MNLETFAKILPMDKVEPDTWYSFSLNPCDKYQYWNRATRIDKSQDHVLSMCKQFKGVAFRLNTELSPRGRVHYHGMIHFKDIEAIAKFYNYGIYHILAQATLEIDTIEDYPKWEQYCSKQDKYIKALGLKTYLKITYVEPPLPSDVPSWFGGGASDPAI